MGASLEAAVIPLEKQRLAGGANSAYDNAPYVEALSYLYGKGVINGTGEGSFSPDIALTRAMVVKMFHELVGAPVPKDMDSFTDVAQDMWHTDAIGWAAAQIDDYAFEAIRWACGKGILSAVSGSRLAPLDNATRAQTVEAIYRFVMNAKEN